MKKTISFFLAFLIVFSMFSLVCFADDYVYIEDAEIVDSGTDDEESDEYYGYSDIDFVRLDAVIASHSITPEQLQIIIDSAVDSAAASIIASNHRGIMDTPLLDYTVTEGLLALLVCFFMCVGIFQVSTSRRF